MNRRTLLAALPARAFEAGDLAEHEVDLFLSHQRHHLVDAVGRGAELLTAMKERQAAGDGGEVERPVER